MNLSPTVVKQYIYGYKKVLLLLVILCLNTNCSSDDTEVDIRIRNVSTRNFENITVMNSSFENLNAGETSEFQRFERAYRIATVFLESEGQEFELLVIDFVGETPLSSGDFTYTIGFDENREELAIG